MDVIGQYSASVKGETVDRFKDFQEIGKIIKYFMCLNSINYKEKSEFTCEGEC